MVPHTKYMKVGKYNIKFTDHVNSLCSNSKHMHENNRYQICKVVISRREERRVNGTRGGVYRDAGSIRSYLKQRTNMGKC